MISRKVLGGGWRKRRLFNVLRDVLTPWVRLSNLESTSLILMLYQNSCILKCVGTHHKTLEDTRKIEGFS